MANDIRDQGGSLWTAFDKAVLGLFEALALLFALPFGEDLYRGVPVTLLHKVYLGIGLVFATTGPFVSLGAKRMYPQLQKAARNVYVWLVIILLIFLYGAYQDVTGPEGYIAAESQKATLIKSLEQAQRERDGAKQDVTEAEAQKATLVEWLQAAQHEANEAKQEKQRPAMLSFPVGTPPAATAAQECVNLAHRSASLNPKDALKKAEIDHIRSTMTALGCGCGASKK